MTRRCAFTLAALALGCSAPRTPAVTSPAAPQAGVLAATPPPPPDPDLHRPPPRRLLDLDWSQLSLATDQDALTAWRRIAPTGADWDDKLQEVPAEAAAPLARALLRGGNFACAPRPPAGACARPSHEMPAASPTAGFDDPCLRRLLALWSLAQLDTDDAPGLLDALRGLAALPPPESELVASALRALDESAQDAQLELATIAWRAGQHDLADAAIGHLDEAHLIEAARRAHLPAALEMLSPEAHRAAYLGAVTDEALAPKARVAAIRDLVALSDPLAADLRAALVTATRAQDCSVAAAAARALDQRGDPRFLPRRPRTASVPSLMRAMCVLARFEALQQSDEPSLLASYVPPRGLERITITYDPLSDEDPDGNGDPHTAQTAELIPRSDAVLPELEDLARALAHCTGAICVSEDREYRFVWSRVGGELLLTRLEIADRPPCPAPTAAP